MYASLSVEHTNARLLPGAAIIVPHTSHRGMPKLAKVDVTLDESEVSSLALEALLTQVHEGRDGCMPRLM